MSNNDDDSDNDNYEDSRDGNENDTEEDLNNNEDNHPPGNESDTEEDLENNKDDNPPVHTLTDNPTAILEVVNGGTEGAVTNDTTTTITNYDTSDPPTILNEILDDDNVNNITNTNVEHDNIDDNTDTTSYFHAQGHPVRTNRRHVKDTNDGSPYIFTTQVQATKSALDVNTTVTVFLHARTAYINSLSTFNVVNSAIQYAAEHLAFIQLGMKAGTKMWGKEGVDAIIKEMKQFHVFAVNDDMESRIGLCMSLGKGTVYAASTKQKFNTTSSTESELVRVSDGMPKMIWTRYFMEAQGYNVEDVYVYSDNQSAMLLEKNGIKSIS